MTTDHLGPLVEGQGRGASSRAKTGPAPGAGGESARRSSATSATSGSDASGACSPTSRPRSGPSSPSWSWARATRGAGSPSRRSPPRWLFYIWVIPDNWYGGGGTVGNRYFLSLLPLVLFLVPRGRVWPVAAFGLVVGRASSSRRSCVSRRSATRSVPGLHATGGSYRFLPARADDAERPVRVHGAVAEEAALRVHGRPARRPTRRRRRLLPLLHGRRDARQGDRWGTGRVPAPRRPAARRSCCAPSTWPPVKRVLLRMTAGPRGDEVEARLGRATAVASLGPGQSRGDRARGGTRGSATTTRTCTSCSSGRDGRPRPRAGRSWSCGCRSARSRPPADERARRPRRPRGVDRPLPASPRSCSTSPPPRTGASGATGRPTTRWPSSLARDFDLRYEARDLDARARRVSLGTAGCVPQARERRARSTTRRPSCIRPPPRPSSACWAPSRGLLFTNAVLLRPRPLARLSRAAPPRRAARRPGRGGRCSSWERSRPSTSCGSRPRSSTSRLVTGGLVAWRRDRPALSAVLLGLATYSKPTNLLLALPLGLEPLVGEWPRRPARVRPPRGDPGRGRARRLRPHLGGHRRGELPGWRAEDVLRLLPLRVAGRDLRQRRDLDDDRAPRAPRGRAGRRQAVGARRPAPPALGDPRRPSSGTSATSGSGGSGERCPTSRPAVLAALLFLLVGPRDRAGWLALATLVRLVPRSTCGSSPTTGTAVAEPSATATS